MRHVQFAWYYFKLHWNWTFGALSVSDRKIVYRVLSFFIKPWDFLIFYENALSGTVYMTRRFENTSIIPMINMAHVISSSCLLSPFIPLVNVSLLCHVQLVKRLWKMETSWLVTEKKSLGKRWECWCMCSDTDTQCSMSLNIFFTKPVLIKCVK